MDRDAILSAEFTRPPQPGLRLLTAGIISLSHQLDLSLFKASVEREKLSAAEIDRETLALTWMLDARNPEDVVYDAPQRGRDWLFAELERYRRHLSPALLALAQVEASLTAKAMAAAMYEIAPKPLPKGSAPPPSPPGNS